MYLEVKGCSRQNKGAELLLLAIKEHYAFREEIRLVVDKWFGSYRDRSEYGLWTMPSNKVLRREAAALKLMPKSARIAYGIVFPEEVDVVLDASGFAFGDQHGPRPPRIYADYYERMKRRGKTIILLPQAYGPFQNPEVARQMRRLLEAVDMCYARDPESADHVRSLGSEFAKVRIAPDITIGLEAPAAWPLNFGDKPVAIVPNTRMLDKLKADLSAKYVPLMIAIIRRVAELGCSPFILVHDEHEDIALAKRIQDEGGMKIQILHERDPMKIKAMIGQCFALIGSRFHALVSALSQSVPSLSIGWSHKYQMLMEDFGCGGNVIELETCPADLRSIDSLLDEGRRHDEIQRLRGRNGEIKALVAEMWREVDERIFARQD